MSKARAFTKQWTVSSFFLLVERQHVLSAAVVKRCCLWVVAPVDCQKPRKIAARICGKKSRSIHHCSPLLTFAATYCSPRGVRIVFLLKQDFSTSSKLVPTRARLILTSQCHYKHSAQPSPSPPPHLDIIGDYARTSQHD